MLNKYDSINISRQSLNSLIRSRGEKEEEVVETGAGRIHNTSVEANLYEYHLSA